MEGRMQEPDPTQDFAGEVVVKKVIMEEKSVGDDASSVHVSVKDNNNIRYEDKAVATSKSTSSSGERTRIYFCSSCPRKFTSQHAMAGHRNTHRNEWESQDEPARGPETPPSHYPTFVLKQEQQSIGSSTNASSTLRQLSSCVPRCPVVNPTNTLKVQTPSSNPTNTLNRHPNLVSPSNTLKGTSPLGNPTIILKEPSPRHLLTNRTNALKGPSPRYPLSNPTNTLIRPSVPTQVPAPRYIFANPTNTLTWPSLGDPHQSFFRTTSTQNRHSIPDLNLPVDNRQKPHGKSALVVRHESMIHKSCQFRQLGQTDMWSRAGSTLFGRQQMMGSYIRGFGTSNNNVHITYLSTAAGFSFSRSEGGGSSEVHDNFSSFQDSFVPTPAQERHNYRNINHSSLGPVRQPDNDGENEATLDVDLELKL